MAHPYISDDGRLALRARGSIANYKELWWELEKDHTFRSYGEKVDDITDSEVAVHMLSDALETGMNVKEAFQHIAPKLTGIFLLSAIYTEEPDTVYICNWYQPCYLAIGKNEVMFVSSQRGLRDAVKYLDRIFQPPKNSILELRRGKVEIYEMDPNREIPHLVMNIPKAIDLIKSKMREEKSIDIRKLFYALNPEGWAEIFNLSSDKWKAYSKAGIYVRNPYFELLETLAKNGEIVESIDLRTEGGIDNVPRFSYKPA